MNAITTRFNPTISGPLHVGHLVTIFVNRDEAHFSTPRGKFHIRVDDTQSYWNNYWYNLGRDAYAEVKKGYDKIFELVDADSVSYQSEMPDLDKIIPFPGGDYTLSVLKHNEQFFHEDAVEWYRFPGSSMYPYAPRYTFEKVVYDFYQGINFMVRGEDLITEAAFYDFICDLMRIPRPEHIYIPRLRAIALDGSLVDISKSKSTKAFSIMEILFRNELTFNDIETKLAFHCLQDPDYPWYVDNLKCDLAIPGNLFL